MVTFAFVTRLRPFAFASCSNAGFLHTSNGILLFLMSARRFCTTSNGILLFLMSRVVFARRLMESCCFEGPMFSGSVANSTIPYRKVYFEVFAETEID